MARTPPARTVGQRPLIALVALVVLAIGATAVADEETARRSVDDAPSAAPVATRPSPSPEPGRRAEVVGPPRGAEVAAYVEDREAALRDAPATVDTAVVSFSDRLSVADALAAVGDAVTVRAVLYRVPIAQAQPRTIRVGAGDDVAGVVEAALQQQVAGLREEQEEAQSYLDSGTVEDEEFLADYERRVIEIDEALGAIEDGRVVHAVVVRAGLAELQALQDATAVRLVDPAPPGTDVAVSTFHGLLPADTDTVSGGRDA